MGWSRTTGTLGQGVHGAIGAKNNADGSGPVVRRSWLSVVSCFWSRCFGWFVISDALGARLGRKDRDGEIAVPGATG